MPAIPHIIRIRDRRREKFNRNPDKSLAILTTLVICLILTGLSWFSVVSYSDFTGNLPSVEILPLLLEPPNGELLQATRFYDRTGEQVIFTLQHPATGERQYLYYPDLQEQTDSDKAFLPANLITTTIAATDPGFWTHPGVTLTSLVSNQRLTIAQRLAGDLLLQQEPAGIRRTFRQSMLAFQIIQRFGHEKAIEWYLNSASYGNLVFGAQAASHFYFGKPASSLNLAEAASLALIADNPGLNLWELPEQLHERRTKVIQEALRLRMITPSEGIQAFRAKPVISLPAQLDGSPQYKDIHPLLSDAFIALAMDQLQSRISRMELERGGLRVITTLDLDLQTQVVCASRVQSSRLLTKADPGAVGIPVDCPAARLLPSLPLKQPLDEGNFDFEAVVLDPTNGQILAIHGKAAKGMEDNHLTKHPAGSLSSVFIYTTAFSRGFSPASLVWDIPSGEIPVENQDLTYHGPVRLRIAFANDYVSSANSVLSQVGTENVLRTIQQIGIQNPREAGIRAISANHLLRPLDILEAAYAISAFANQGSLAGRVIESASPETPANPITNAGLPPIQPTSILRVEDGQGSVRLDWSLPQKRPILIPSLAYLVTHVLSDEIARWPSLGHPNALEIGRPAAAKISSTPEGKSNWVIGFTPRRIVGVWLGGSSALDDPESGVQDARGAVTGLWHAVMQYSNQALPFETFPIPDGLSFIQVCDPSGLLPTAACPNVVDEVFLSNSEPIQIDTLYRMVSINRESGLLATVFTPPDLVEQRSYISIPPEAEQWAKNAGLETPPEIYDTIPLQSQSWSDTQISSPKMLAHLQGLVTISGKATGAGFSSFRLQYGKGPNPTSWYQIRQDSQIPVNNGALASWDVSELDGLYTLQLLVVRDDQSVERSTILVTADNEPPEIEILSPQRQEVILQTQRPKIVLQAEITEGLGLKTVSFRIDGKLIANILQPPYAISWNAVPGNHIFEVTAVDEAGNSSRAENPFSVE